MPQPKGHTGNPYGRPKGVPNKTTSTIRNWMVQLINENREQLEQDFKSLEPKDRLALMEKLLPYLMPKVVTDWAVEGACYGKESIKPPEEVGLFEMQPEVRPAGIYSWYERPTETEQDQPEQ